MADEKKPAVPPAVTPASVPPRLPGDAKMQSLKDATAAENARLRVSTAKPVQWSLPGGFDFSDVSALYGSLRDGDYYGTFKRAVRILDTVLNEAQNPNSARMMGAPSASRLRDAEAVAASSAMDKLDDEIDALEESGDETVNPTVRAVNNPTAQFAIRKGELAGLLRVLMGYLMQFKS